MSTTLFAPGAMAAAAEDALIEQERTDQSALQLIVQRGYPDDTTGERWLDTRPMLDEREVGLRMVDHARVAVAHALRRRLVEQHPAHAHLVRVPLRRRAAP